jgi:hypothetical protein
MQALQEHGRKDKRTDKRTRKDGCMRCTLGGARFVGMGPLGAEPAQAEHAIRLTAGSQASVPTSVPASVMPSRVMPSSVVPSSVVPSSVVPSSVMPARAMVSSVVCGVERHSLPGAARHISQAGACRQRSAG